MVYNILDKNDSNLPEMEISRNLKILIYEYGKVVKLHLQQNEDILSLSLYLLLANEIQNAVLFLFVWLF